MAHDTIMSVGLDYEAKGKGTRDTSKTTQSLRQQSNYEFFNYLEQPYRIVVVVPLYKG